MALINPRSTLFFFQFEIRQQAIALELIFVVVVIPNRKYRIIRAFSASFPFTKTIFLLFMQEKFQLIFF